MPTLVQLQYAISVERTRHFGKAADACHVTQPTLSQQLQKLEDEVGIILFDRTKQPILPTPEGQQFLEQARIVLRESDKLLHISKQTREGVVRGDFRLAVIPTIASYFLPRFIGPFSKGFPEVKLSIEEMKTENILTELERDGIDGAILATPVQGAEHKVHPLYYESFYVYLSAGHELLRFKELTKNHLDVNQMWLLQDGHCFKDQVMNYCHLSRVKKSDQSGIASNIYFQSGSLDTIRRIVQKNQGYTLIPEMMALSLKKEEQAIHVRPFKSPTPTREVSLIYRRDHWKLDIIDAIEKTVAQCLPKYIRTKPDKSQQVLEVG